MSDSPPLAHLTEALAAAVPPVDATTEGQYGKGLGSEPEERQLDLVLDYLSDVDRRERNDSAVHQEMCEDSLIEMRGRVVQRNFTFVFEEEFNAEDE